ncbi:YcnI family protein [Nocardioides sp. MH1]|uniref:YcnI family copper-binding membrane protein n=1 Tax=Nocardioides sp. MH1 TaxID=3242490 RepID=UPI00352018F3
MHIRRSVVPAAAAAGALALVAAPASAHVTISPDTTAAGAYAVLTVSVPHGCDGSATTRIAVKMPEEINSVTPTRNPYWDVAKKMVTLDQPVTDAHGNELTERVDQVVYTARKPLPDGQRDIFELSLQLPEEEGTTLAFPVVQTCQEGETGWTEQAADGQDPEELEHPAPLVTITAADAAEVNADPGSDDDDGDDGGDGNGLALAGLGTGILGIVVGGLALARTRKG